MTTTTRADHETAQMQGYLWVVGAGTDTVPVGQQIGDRYQVIAPRIWQDLTPTVPPHSPDTVPLALLPYVTAHPYRLHLPGVYDVIPQRDNVFWVLLENVPINQRTGQLFPALADAWAGTSATRQLSWLWQLWQLWDPLMALGVASSLLQPANLRVEGWRLQLLQLYPDSSPPTIEALLHSWQALLPDSQPTVQEALTQLCQQPPAGERTVEQFVADLNYYLLKESAQTRYQFRITGGTDPGPQCVRNEDACYPEGDSPETPTPRMALVCDGVGGHEAGEVASRIALKGLLLQFQGLLAEFDQEETLLSPDVVMLQIEAAIRVVNDLVSAQNDSQSRSDRQRMGTTLVMALVIPQRLPTPQGWLQVDELYIAHVGDSRAYWITPDYCHPLTVDDDIAGRNTRAGKAFYASLRDRPEMGALTQAIGTRSNDYLRPHVQRFILDGEGVLLLCSDGLSDNRRIDAAWANYIGLITKDIITLQSAVDSWIELANQKNGHDNVSVVLLQARPFAESAYEAVETPGERPREDATAQSELTDASKALLYSGSDGEAASRPPSTTPAKTSRPVLVPYWWIASIAIGIMAIAAVAGWWIAGQLAPSIQPENRPESVE